MENGRNCLLSAEASGRPFLTIVWLRFEYDGVARPSQKNIAFEGELLWRISTENQEYGFRPVITLGVGDTSHLVCISAARERRTLSFIIRLRRRTILEN